MQVSKPINDMHPSDASVFRDHLFDKGMSSASVRRVFASVKSIINLAIREHGLNCTNVFAGAFIPDDAASAKRLPIPVQVIKSIQEECRSINDENRWLVALISDTGMRLSEATGLHVNDIRLNEDIPYVDLKPHPWRPLKTKEAKGTYRLLVHPCGQLNKLLMTIVLMLSPDMLRKMKSMPTQLALPSTNGLSLEYQKAVLSIPLGILLGIGFGQLNVLQI